MMVSTEFCLNTEYWLIFHLQPTNILNGVHDGVHHLDILISAMYQIVNVLRKKTCHEEYFVLSANHFVSFGAIFKPILNMMDK
jgi:hypothetical protein